MKFIQTLAYTLLNVALILAVAVPEAKPADAEVEPLNCGRNGANLPTCL